MFTNKLINIIKDDKYFYHNIFYPEIMQMFIHSAYIFDLSATNTKAIHLNWQGCNALLDYTKQTLTKNNAKVAISKYAEKRVISRQNYKKVHLCLDLSVPAKTKIFCPIDRVVYSFASGLNYGYGNVAVLHHKISKKIKFYSLWGHISNDSVANIKVDKEILKGQHFANVGNTKCNGNWPPHLHLQIIVDMQGFFANFPGTCDLKDYDQAIKNCPNPALLFNNPYRDKFFSIK